MNSIKQTYVIAARPEEVWRALTDPTVIRKWSGGPAEFPLEVGARYSLWDGDFGGEIVEVVPVQKLAQTWEPSYWTVEDSVVTFTLIPQRGGTRVDLLHENVEPSDYEGTRQGWDLYYLGAIKRMLERPVPPRRGAETKTKTVTSRKTIKKAAKRKTRAKAKPTAASRKTTKKRK